MPANVVTKQQVCGLDLPMQGKLHAAQCPDASHLEYATMHLQNQSNRLALTP